MRRLFCHRKQQDTRWQKWVASWRSNASQNNYVFLWHIMPRLFWQMNRWRFWQFYWAIIEVNGQVVMIPKQGVRGLIFLFARSKAENPENIKVLHCLVSIVLDFWIYSKKLCQKLLSSDSSKQNKIEAIIGIGDIQDDSAKGDKPTYRWSVASAQSWLKSPSLLVLGEMDAIACGKPKILDALKRMAVETSATMEDTLIWKLFNLRCNVMIHILFLFKP